MAPVETVKLAEFDPCATITSAGTVNAASLLDSVTATPPEPAACDRTTEQTDVSPEVRVAGLHESWLAGGAATSDTGAVSELPL